MYNFFCESVSSDALEEIKTEISVAMAMRGIGDVIDELFNEVYERGSLLVCGVSVSLVPTTMNSLCSSRIRDHSRFQRRGCLPSQGNACSLMLYEMENKGISGRVSIVDSAVSTLERKPALWV